MMSINTTSTSHLNVTLEPLLPVCDYVYHNYLSKAYTDTEIMWDWVLYTANGQIERPNHGLAHSMRVAHLIPVVAHFLAQNTKDSGFNLSEKQIQLIQISALFFVVGRENDCGFSDNSQKYMQYRLNSAKAFEQFARACLSLTEEEIQHYTQLVYNPSNDIDALSPEAKVLNFAHILDLLRCFSPSEIQHKVKNKFKPYLPDSETEKLLDYAENLLHATGDRVYVGKNPSDYNKELFFKTSTCTKTCFEALAQVEVPTPKPGMKMSCTS